MRRNTLPKTAEDYKAELPADFKAPDGLKFEFKTDSVLFKQAQALMHDIDSGKLSGQQAFSRLLALNAAGQIDTAQQIKSARDAEIAKLGPTAPSRIDAVMNWMKAKVGDDFAGAFAQMMVTAKHVELGERIVQLFTSQGSATFSQQHRDPGGNGAMTQEQWDKMSFADKQAWQTAHPKAA